MLVHDFFPYTPQDECSFVSLRDVERTMIVFHFFREKFNLFRRFTAVKAEKKVCVYCNALVYYNNYYHLVHILLALILLCITER